MSSSFETSAYGKWILSGEHSVLRGGRALVFPVFSKKMVLNYNKEEGKSSFIYQTEGMQSEVLAIFFEKVLDKSLCLVKKRKSDLQGKLTLKNEIPIGTGLGSSASLSVLVARWFEWLKWIEKEEVFSFAKKLEDLAHGKSSGVDIAAVLREEGLIFSSVEKQWPKISPNWRPKFYLCHSGSNSLTQKCVESVEEKNLQNQKLGKSIDLDMQLSVEKGIASLQGLAESSKELLVESIGLARSCFAKWGLINSEMEKKIKWMESHGAIAVKPVGSGDGGYLVGLWDEEPSVEIQQKLISCF